MNVNVELSALSVMLGLIGKVFYAYPEKDFYERLFSEDVFAEMPTDIDNDDFRTGSAILAELSASPEDLESVQSDYTHMFLLGKAETGPWQSAFISPERTLFEPSILKVREWYNKYSLMSERQYKEPDDHAGLMLIFAGYLADRAEESGDETIAQDFKEYCDRMLMNWLPDWCTQVAYHAKTNYFKGMALLAKGILQAL